VVAEVVPVRGFSRTVRLVLVVVLVLGGLLAGWFGLHQDQRSVEEFTSAVQAHRVTWVQISGSGASQSALWSTGWTHWSRTQATDLEGVNINGGGTPHADLRAIARRGGLNVHGADSFFWWWNLPATGLRLLVGGAAVLTFLGMLWYGGTRIGNRWYWLWMCTYGQVGVILYLLLEPEPLRPWVGRALRFFAPPASDPRKYGGIAGALMAFAMSVVSIIFLGAVFVFVQAFLNAV
jgi:hypothetical protein